MALSVSNQRRILKMLKELVDQKQFRIVCATHSPVLIEDAADVRDQPRPPHQSQRR